MVPGGDEWDGIYENEIIKTASSLVVFFPDDS
jgi:hypothetical protein